MSAPSGGWGRKRGHFWGVLKRLQALFEQGLKALKSMSSKRSFSQIVRPKKALCATFSQINFSASSTQNISNHAGSRLFSGCHGFSQTTCPVTFAYILLPGARP